MKTIFIEIGYRGVQLKLRSKIEKVKSFGLVSSNQTSYEDNYICFYGIGSFSHVVFAFYGWFKGILWREGKEYQENSF